MESARHSVSVAGVVLDDAGRALAIRRRDNGKWEPPGGVLELDESIIDGLIREVREETGLTVVPERLSGVYKNMRRGIVALVFRCRLVDGEPTTSAEAAEIAWFTADQISDAMDEAYAIRMLDALELDDATVRVHDGVSLLRP
jgi:ADP-ribose pyrophosphatase YjhB (NUDIX family)